MKKSGGPVKQFPLAEAARDAFVKAEGELPLPDFSNTEETFRHLSDKELRDASLMFSLMGKDWLTNIMSGLGVSAVKWGIPGAAWGVKNTIYRQFVGGTSLVSALPKIERLHERGVTSLLDYGAEAKSTTEDYNNFMKEVLRGIDFSAEAPAAIAVVVKISGLAPDDMLIQLNDKSFEYDTTDGELQATLRRLEAICAQAEKKGVQVYIDAEESWMQNSIDTFADRMMAQYNRERVVVLNTYQLYRHDRLQFLKDSHEKARREGYKLGAKLVRGAYMVKENARAEEMGYPSPIQPSLQATHDDYNAAVAYCIDNITSICACLGTHNEESTRLGTELLKEKEIPRNHPHIHFAQLLGMSGNLTFNLAAGGYNVSKYLVYGPVKEVLPYLVRRAQENTSVTGEMGRELKMLREERARRKV
ncbi:proline dehydrogenase family protein [Neolewinella agarilytica]|uniref:L-proline dehydrogenase n=1 Tax=Neolewinella agarilytica TaxID=478744 RepID=A0A1H9KRH0_9BACT|nr:proline dehydrogenase family protein [Neolewinella agarilytica]SER01766.1 L-proline dehydrogenase [Neolewinella agarilytica]